jgi:hypothetical protein
MANTIIREKINLTIETEESGGEGESNPKEFDVTLRKNNSKKQLYLPGTNNIVDINNPHSIYLFSEVHQEFQ